MAESERVRNEVIYKKEITTDEPDAHAELIMKIEGVTDEKMEELRKKFNALYEDMAAVVREETKKADPESQPGKEMCFCNGRPKMVNS